MRASRLSHQRDSTFRRIWSLHLVRHVALAAAAGSLVAGMVYAVTTISTNIATDGTMAITGRATTSASLVVGTTQPGPWDLGAGDLFIGNEASTTGNLAIGIGSGSNDDSLYFDSVSSEYLSWLDGRTEFSLSDDLTISGNATSTGYLVIGATQPIVNMAAGDLLIGAAGTTTGNFALGGGSGSNDDSLFFDSVSSEALSWDDSPGQFQLTDDLIVNGTATTTGNLEIGTGSSYASTTNLVLGGDGADLGTYNDLRVNAGSLFFNALNLSQGALQPGAWQAFSANVLSPTNTSAGIIVNASSTISGGLTSSGNATTTGYFVIGTTQPILNMAAGDLLVGAAGTTTGNFAVGGGSGTNDDSLFFDSVSSEYLSWLDGRTEFSLSDDLTISGNATSTGYLVVGTNNPTSNLAAGNLWVGATASSTNLVVSGNSTTTGSKFSIGHSTQTANSTTTVTFGSYEATGSNQGVCFKIRQGTGFIYCIADVTNNFKCTTGSCE